MPEAITCVECGLSLIGEGAGDAILTRFPDDLGACFAHFAFGPSVILCRVCRTPNEVPVPTIMIEPGAHTVVYAPESLPDDALSGLRKGFEEADVSITRDRRGFRTAAIRGFLAPRLSLLNAYLLAEDPVEWVAQNEDQIDTAFSAALWLAITAKVQVFRSEAIPDGTAFRKHEEVEPERLRHDEQDNARTLIVENLAEMLGFLLQMWVSRSLERRGLSDYVAAVPGITCHSVLEGSVGEALARFVGDVGDNIEVGQPGWMLLRHVVETHLALLCDAHRVPNPRARDWTINALLYEYGRRIDGNEGFFSLDEATCRRLVDRKAFADGVQAISHNIGPLSAETKERHLMLLEAAVQLAPEQAAGLLQPRIAAAGPTGINEEQPLERLLDVALTLGEEEKIFYALEAIIRGIGQEALVGLPAFLARIAQRGGGRLGDRDLIRLSRLAIELLNAAGLFDEGWAAAQQALPRLSALSADDEERGFFLNEVGNCHRYAGRFGEALKAYEQALDVVGRDLDNKNGRIALRNIAIVLRDSNHYDKAREMLAQLRPYTEGAELVGSVTSEALCLYRLGEPEKGLALLDRYQGLAEMLGSGTAHTRAFTGLRSQLLMIAGEPEKAVAVAGSLREQARRAGDALALAGANLILLEVKPDAALQDETVELLRTLIDQLSEQRGIGHFVMGMVERLHGLLTGREEFVAAATLLDEAIPALWSTHDPALWTLLTLSAWGAVQAGDHEKASESLILAAASFQQAMSAIADVGDPAKALGPYASRLDLLVSMLLDPAAEGMIPADCLASLIADLPAAPVLTAHLRKSAGLPTPLNDVEGHERRLADLIGATPAILVQAVATASGIALVLIRAGNRPDSVDYEIRPLPLSAADAEGLVRRLAFHLGRIPPSGDLGLDEVRGWTDFAATLRACLPPTGGNAQLVVAPGPLNPIAFSLAVAPETALSFTPGLEALLALRRRREALPGGIAWRPKSLFDFAVWRRGEKPAVAAGLALSAEKGATLAAEFGLSHASAVGAKADREALLSGLRGADAARLTCHGRLISREETVDLIVANDDELPPSSALALLSPASAGHIVGWRDLSDVARAPGLVVSSACHSGDAVRHRGGERLGLERPLFAAGAVCYVAPMWPVPTLASQDFSTEFLRRLLLDEEVPLAVALGQLRRDSIERGVSPLAAAAFGAFGDAL